MIKINTAEEVKQCNNNLVEYHTPAKGTLENMPPKGQCWRIFLCLIACLSTMIGGTVLVGAAFRIGHWWLAIPGLVIIAVGFNALACVCSYRAGNAGKKGGQVAEIAKV